MPRIWKALIAASTLALTLVVWGCEQPTELDNPSPQIEVETESSRLAGPGDLAGFNSVASTLGQTVAGTVTARVGANGGTLELAGHVLTVPRGSVRGPTTFTLRVVPNGGIEVELQATTPGSRPNNVGSQGFDRPVRLVLSFAGTNGVDAEDLVIVRVDDGEPQETHVSANGSSVWADLAGFSRYRLCSN